MNISNNERVSYINTIINNEMSVNNFLKKVNILYMLLIVFWFSYSVYTGTILYDKTFDIQWEAILVTTIIFFVIVKSLFDGDWITAILPIVFLIPAYQYFSHRIDFSFHIDPIALIHFEYVSLAALAINSIYTLSILMKTKITHALPFTKIFSFFIILLVLISLNILKTYYVINSVNTISLYIWSFLQATGIILVALSNLFVKHLEVFDDQLDLIKKVLRVKAILFAIIITAMFYILDFYTKNGINSDIGISLAQFNTIGSLGDYIKYGVNFYNTISLSDFTIMSSLVSMIIISYILKFSYESIVLLPSSQSSKWGDIGITYIMGILLITLSLGFIQVPTVQQFLEYCYVMTILMIVMIMLRNIYSTRLILSVLFISFILPFGYFTIDYWHSVHGFFGIIAFILSVSIGIPFYTFLIVLIGKISISVSGKVYNSFIAQILLIILGSILFIYLRDKSVLLNLIN